MTTWKIDPAHTDVNFSAKHMMVTTVRGKFGQVDGSITLDDADLTKSHGEFRVGASSLTTGVERRDQHLRSADFFDVEQFPSITFVSTGIASIGKDRYAVTGGLTIKETTRPVTFDVEVLGYYSSMSGTRRVGLSATAKIDRDNWNLNWNVAIETGGWMVGKTITLEIEVAADQATIAEPVLVPVAA